MSVALTHFLATYGLLAIFGLMLVKEAGIPLPIPSDLLMLTAGVQAATGVYSLPILALALAGAVLLGGSVQFLLMQRAGGKVVARFGRFIGLTPARLEQARTRLQRRGRLAIVVGLNVPGARAAVLPAAGLAGLSYRTVAPAMLLGSGLFYGWHVALGYLVGPSAVALLGQIHLPLLPIFLGLALLGLVGWLILRRRRKASAGAAPADDTAERLRAWSEAACPACLAVAAARRLTGQPVAQETVA